MAKLGRRHTSDSLDTPMLIISLIMGVIGYIVSMIVYNLIKESMSGPLSVGLSFMIFAVVFILLMVFVNLRNDNLGYHIAKHHDGGQIFIALLLIIILVFGLGVLFEFLYERNIKTEPLAYQEPTSYIFVIDNSGSMETSDPEGTRYDAIKQIMSGKDTTFPYAVYSFSDSVVEERALAPVSAGNNDFQTQNLGGTAIRGALTSIYKECQSNLSAQLGVAPKILLLTDGHATDVAFGTRINKLLKNYAKDNITISTVGFGSPDESLMQQIADTTGGVYIGVDNIAMLEDAMEKAINEQGKDLQRTLYTYRVVPNFSFLYAIMRIIFTAILGVLISCAMLFATGKGEDSERIIISSVITGVLAGLLLEVGINAVRLPQGVMRLIYFLLVASTFITQKAFGGSGKGRSYQESETVYDIRVGRKQMGNIAGVGSDFDNDFGGSQNNGNSQTSGSSFDDFF